MQLEATICGPLSIPLQLPGEEPFLFCRSNNPGNPKEVYRVGLLLHAHAKAVFTLLECRVQLQPRSGATMTAIGTKVYLYGGQVKLYNKSGVPFVVLTSVKTCLLCGSWSSAGL